MRRLHAVDLDGAGMTAPTFTSLVAEALLALPIPRKTHSASVVKNILAPRVVAALEMASDWSPAELIPEWKREAILRALRGEGGA